MIEYIGSEVSDNLQTAPGWIGILAALIWFALRVIKDPRFKLINVDNRWLPLIAIVLGGTLGVLTQIARGVVWTEAIQTGVYAALASMAFQDIVVKAIFGSKIDPPKLAILALLCIGCNSNTARLQTAATIHNYSVEAINGASPILRERCVDPMTKAAAAADREAAIAIDRRCAVPIAAWDGARGAVIGLQAAIILAATGDFSKLEIMIADVVATVGRVGTEIARLARGQ